MDGGWDEQDRLLARSIFGTDEAPRIEALLLEWLAARGFGGGRIVASELSVGAGVSIALADGTMIFVKVWPGATGRDVLAAQMAVQTQMTAQGFPAPSVLTELSPLGAGLAAAMEYSREGVPTDARLPGVRRHMAQGLARFIAEAQGCRDVAALPQRDPPPLAAIWPKPHNVLFDFAATAAGAEWIDAIAAEALAVLRAATSPIVPGHLDWSAKNMRMGPGGIAVVYDWDSVFLERESFILGSAAAHFPVTWELPVPETPAPEEVAAFVADYEAARGRRFTARERVEIAAGATYARAYKARCEHALDPGGAHREGSSCAALRREGAYEFG